MTKPFICEIPERLLSDRFFLGLQYGSVVSLLLALPAIARSARCSPSPSQVSRLSSSDRIHPDASGSVQPFHTGDTCASGAGYCFGTAFGNIQSGLNGMGMLGICSWILPIVWLILC